MSEPLKLYYVMDPMCSWCWGFSRPWTEVSAEIAAAGEASIRWVMGGLAPDSDQPMPESMRRYLQQTWRRIEQLTGAPFNHEYWAINTPRRSTYPACRAAIAAGALEPGALPRMVAAIQKAYYLEARNPSDESVLCEAAESIGLDRAAFAAELGAARTADALAADFEWTRGAGIEGFPALLTEAGDGGDARRVLVSAGYCDAETLRARWREARARLAPGHR